MRPYKCGAAGRSEIDPYGCGACGSMWALTPTGWRGTVVLIPSGMALPCHLPLGTKGRQFLDSAAADDGEDFAVEILQGDGAVGTTVGCVGAEVAQQEHASLGDAVGQGQRV